MRRVGENRANQFGVEFRLHPDWVQRAGAWLVALFLFTAESAVTAFPSVLYFSIHRYEGGNFWPHLPESDSHAVGRGRGEGYNINVPWNQVGKSRDSSQVVGTR